jgi:hypothetical protein
VGRSPALSKVLSLVRRSRRPPRPCSSSARPAPARR